MGTLTEGDGTQVAIKTISKSEEIEVGDEKEFVNEVKFMAKFHGALKKKEEENNV